MSVDFPRPVWPAYQLETYALILNEVEVRAVRTDDHDIELEPAFEEFVLDLAGDHCVSVIRTGTVQTASRDLIIAEGDSECQRYTTPLTVEPNV